MANTPLGLYWKNDYVRCLKSVFTSETKKYLLSEMKRNPKNFKTVVVLDDNTKKAECFFPNDKLTDFDQVHDLLGKTFCKKVEARANYQINKYNTQQAKISADEREKIIRTIEHRDLHKLPISQKDKSEMAKGLRDTKNKKKYETALTNVDLTASLKDIIKEKT